MHKYLNSRVKWIDLTYEQQCEENQIANKELDDLRESTAKNRRNDDIAIRRGIIEHTAWYDTSKE